MSYKTTVLAESSIQAYYDLNETSGTSAIDSTANAFNGTLNGTITLNQPAIVAGLDPCMLFDGSTGYILLPTGVNLAPPFSIEMWIKDNGITANGFFFSNNTLAGVGFGWDVTNSNKVFVYGHSGSYDTANALVSGNTYYLCLTVDASNNYVIFVGRVGTDTAPSQWGTGAPGGAPTYSGGSSIGRRSDNTAKFKGYISSVAVYSAVLTSAQKNSHYTAGTTAGGSAALAGTLSGVGTLAGTAQLSTALTSLYAGVGALTGVADFSTALTSALPGVGALSSSLQASTALSAPFSGLGTLSASSSLSTYLLASLDGLGSLSGLSTLRTSLSALLPGSGSIIGSLQGGGGELPFGGITHTAVQVLSAVWGVLSALGLSSSQVSALILVHQGMPMPAPNTTILSTITVMDTGGALVSNASAVSLVIYFPDGTSSNMALGSGITNLGAGQYQAKYNTKQAGEIREVWSIVGADGTTLASAQFLVGVEY